MSQNELTLKERQLIFPNFSGKEDRFNKNPGKNFSILLTNPEEISFLISTGWEVKTWRPEDSDSDVYFLKVKIKYTHRPPFVYQVRPIEGKRIPLTESTIASLDLLPIKHVDVKLAGYDWEVLGSTGRAAYLVKMNAVIDEDELDLIYGNIPIVES